ncbi:MAG: hypothetical protein ABIT37_05115 [Luteolibacter sp.]
MNLPHARMRAPSQGFALVITLSLMILLTILAVGLLSLSSISLRSAAAGEAVARANANSRMALMLALGELQKAAGDDRRITADGSISDGAKYPNTLGVWRSWSPKLAEDPLKGAQDYQAIKNAPDRFVSWLTSSGSPADLANKDWAKTGTLASPFDLFTPKSDGFQLSGSKVDVQKGKPSAGTMAWAITQDATRAKINVAGPEDNQRLANEDLQAQARPSLAKSGNYKQPAGDWNKRSARVISMAQAELDSDLWKGGATNPEGADFTSQGLGLLTDVVNGGLKTDLSLGFEMSDADFKQDTWGTFKNPFRAASAPLLATPTSYQGQRPLFKPLTTSGSVHVDLSFSPANTSFEFPAAAVPTFDTLRSFFRTPYHLYNTPDGPTVFERGMDHVALKQASGGIPSPGATPPALASKTSYRPVLDRMIYLLSIGVGADKEVRLIITPIVTLWNPYNVALEIEGAVAYPWIDVPFRTDWTFYKAGAKEGVRSHGLSQIMSSQFIAPPIQHGRTINPYFFASITADGSGTAGAGQSIRFKPGEVRVFAPANQTDVEYITSNSIRKRTLALKPVTDPNQLSARGGFAVPMRNVMNNTIGFSRPMALTDSVELSFIPSTTYDYPFSVGLEDATRAKLANPTDADRGQLVSDIQTINFSVSGATASMKSPVLAYTDLTNPATRQPFGMIETYHRVANDISSSRRSDLVFTINPRQPFINRYLTTGSFQAGPHYETRMTSISSFNQVMQTTNGGRSSFYGRSNNSLTGESELSFFEVPQSPLLSLAAFQHADVSGTSYSTANQLGNSWASAYLKKEAAAEKISAGSGGTGQATYNRAEMPVYDYSYLANETLWDSFYFSGASSSLKPGTSTGSPSVWNSAVANITTSYKNTLTEFIDDPQSKPLRNPRMAFRSGNSSITDLKADLVKPEGCLKLAAHLSMDGAFNINSTSEKAWIAFLSGMRDRNFTVRNGSPPAAGQTAFSRFRNPIGTDSNHWMGFRSLSDSQVEELAKKIILQVKARGPFLSLGEFVNRRIDNSSLALSGAIQTAIDSSNINQSALYDPFVTSGYPPNGKANIVPANTGVGIPGYLTQADVLQSIAPVMAARSDTFTIRAYGEAKDASGKVTATSWCEAVVQRMPEFLDKANPSYATMAELNPVNLKFGRTFSIVSFRYLSNQEVVN